jgi:hypothetical protein
MLESARGKKALLCAHKQVILGQVGLSLYLQCFALRHIEIALVELFLRLTADQSGKRLPNLVVYRRCYDDFRHQICPHHSLPSLCCREKLL